MMFSLLAVSLASDSSTLQGLWRGSVPLGHFGAASLKRVWMCSCCYGLVEHLMNITVCDDNKKKESANEPVTYRPSVKLKFPLSLQTAP